MPGFNPFRNRFPYTNINDINLDWIIKKVKALSDAVASIDISRMDEIAQQAETAQQDAETALATAQSAETTANSVQGIANNALSTAQSAETTAQSAETTAQSAQTAATALNTNKADKVQNATNGNFAGLDANGNLTDSGHNNGDYAPSSAGVPPGGAAGQVLTKTGAADYADAWQTPTGGGDVTADMLAVVVNGHATPVGADKGQYVIVKNSTIEGITDGLYKAAVPIPANTVLYDTDFSSKIDKGGFNELEAYQGDKYIQSYLNGNNTNCTITLTFEGSYPSFLAFGVNNSGIIESTAITSNGVTKQLVGTSTNDLNPAKISNNSCSLSLKGWASITIISGKRFTIS